MQQNHSPASSALFLATALFAGSFAGRAEVLPNAPVPQTQKALSQGKPVPATRPSTPQAVENRQWSGVVEPGETIPAFTAKDKLIYPLHEALRWTTPAGVLASAAYGTWTGSDPKYGSNGTAFGKRVGVEALNGVISRELTDSLLPIAFRQDPRYYRQARGSYEQRAIHAARFVLVSRNDSGSQSFNYSQVLGLGAAAALTQTYYPARSVYTGDVFKTWGYSLLELGGINLFNEFWPDVKRKVFHKAR